MKAVWNGHVVAESTDTVVVDGNHYFPPACLKSEFFSESSRTNVCGWKGTANCYSLNVDGQTNGDAAWYYTEPKDAAKQIRGHVAFWKGVIVSP